MKTSDRLDASLVGRGKVHEGLDCLLCRPTSTHPKDAPPRAPLHIFIRLLAVLISTFRVYGAQKLAVGLLVISLGCISEMSPTDPLDRPDSWVKGAQLCLGGLGVGFTVGVTLDTVAGVRTRWRRKSIGS